MKVIEWAKSHPVPAGLILVGGGFVVLMVLRGSGGSGSASAADSTNAAAYYAAQAEQTQSGNQVQMTQIAAQAATAQAAIQAGADTTNATTWANAAVTQDQSNNAASMALAPYQVQESAISSLSSLASLPPVTTTKSSNGFFGIGASTKTTSAPDPAAIAAASYLGDIASGNYAAH